MQNTLNVKENNFERLKYEILKNQNLFSDDIALTQISSKNY